MVSLLDALACLLSVLLGVLPWRLCVRTGGALGRLTGAIPSRKSSRILRHLARAGVRQPCVAYHKAWTHAGETLVQMLALTGRSAAQVWPLLTVRGAECLQAAVAAGRGVLVISAHTGNWEMVALGATLGRAPVALIARQLKLRRLQERLIAFRERCGVRTLMRERPMAALSAMRWLKSGGTLACMVDRASRGRRLCVPFLGKGTDMPLGPAEMARRTGAAIVLGLARSLGDGGTEVVFSRVPVPAGAGAEEQTRIFGQTLEAEMRSRPEQWLCLYRRQPAARERPVMWPELVSPALEAVEP